MLLPIRCPRSSCCSCNLWHMSAYLCVHLECGLGCGNIPLAFHWLSCPSCSCSSTSSLQLEQRLGLSACSAHGIYVLEEHIRPQGHPSAEGCFAGNEAVVAFSQRFEPDEGQEIGRNSIFVTRKEKTNPHKPAGLTCS